MDRSVLPPAHQQHPLDSTRRPAGGGAECRRLFSYRRGRYSVAYLRKYVSHYLARSSWGYPALSSWTFSLQHDSPSWASAQRGERVIAYRRGRYSVAYLRKYVSHHLARPSWATQRSRPGLSLSSTIAQAGRQPSGGGRISVANNGGGLNQTTVNYRAYGFDGSAAVLALRAAGSTRPRGCLRRPCGAFPYKYGNT